MTGLLDRAAIMAANDLRTEDVEVPEWGGTVRVRSLTGSERDQFENEVIERKGKKTDVNMRDIRAKLVVLACVDGEGRRVFSDDDVRWLTKKSAAALDRVATVAQLLAGLRAEDMQEMSKNSPNGQSGDSISD